MIAALYVETRSRTPLAFRDVLLDLARSASRCGVEVKP